MNTHDVMRALTAGALWGMATIAAAADVAAPVAADPAVPLCAKPPATGEQLAGDMALLKEGHSIQIENSGTGDALVKLRHADTGKLAASFYVAKAETMLIDGVPDGEYRIQYAFGPALAADCKSFTRIIRANALPGTDDMKTETIDDDEHTEVKRSSVSYTLSVNETGNVKPVRIDPAAFNAD